ncbi:DUF1223 domain-containing protein [Kiloniella sp. b19]|uniref:DUF1223 domain-containing protein n=1 Tax=Kiloniella sp. GXU_MW_B19 TaxID=3141326 RepID=UPI0031E2E52C
MTFLTEQKSLLWGVLIVALFTCGLILAKEAMEMFMGLPSEEKARLEQKLADGQIARASTTEIGFVSPVVVELFTSQGCSSCPPAEALLNQLAEQPGVIALAHHVDYWDYIGWKDPFARPEATERQRDYASTLDLRYIYTPQMVIDGQEELVGSRRAQVLSEVQKAASTPNPVQLRMKSMTGPLPVGSDLRIELKPRDEQVSVSQAVLWLAVYDQSHETQIRRGENAGKLSINNHVVRHWLPVTVWNGTDPEINFTFPEIEGSGVDQGFALILQQGETGPILGASLWENSPDVTALNP